MSKKIAAIIIKILLIVILLLGSIMIVFAGITGGAILEVMKTAPEIDADAIKYEMSQNSTVVDEDGNEVDLIATSQYREIVSYDDIPDNLKNAFVAVEDERFEDHDGIDIMSIFGSMLENIKAGGIVRGGSTITQQLARNTYLTNDQTYQRKIKEIYLALEIEDHLSKEEILGAYLNRVFMGQNSYGVQAAANTYFNKDVKELNLAQCAALAGLVQSPSEYSLYKSIKTSEVTDERVLGEFTIDGTKYSAVFNEAPLKRENYVLDKMYELGYIDESELKEAKSFDIAKSIAPAQRANTEITSYFNSLLEKQVVAKLMEKEDMSENQAWDRLYYGGLKITTTLDQEMQRNLEDIYANFSAHLMGDTSGWDVPPLLNMKYDNWGNIINSSGRLLYYAKGNFLNENNDIRLSAEEAHKDNKGNIILTTNKAYLDQTKLVFRSYYSLDEENRNLRTHKVGLIDFSSNKNIYLDKDENIVISKKYLDKNKDIFKAYEDGTFSVNKDFYDMDLEGVIQPQSSTVIIDHKTGHIKALMGGRDQKGQRILDRASAVPRQPGSSIKPIATYTPALDNGFNLATGLDDVPFMIDEDNKPWPNNVYGYYMGVKPLREALKLSINTTAVSTLDKVGIDTSLEYLKNFGIIKEDGKDNFITSDENRETNDENLAAMGLGAMTNGLTALDMTGAYAALANGGKYLEPLTFSKIVDSTGKVLFEDKDKISHEVTSPDTAYQITSALEDAGKSYGNIYLNGIEFATKTGTTDDYNDFWCMGYTPYYTVGIWMGCDNQNISLTGTSANRAALMWNVINNKILEGYEATQFDVPKTIVSMQVDTMSGKLPTDASFADPRGTVITEIFGEKNKPTEEDDVHEWVSVDSRNNLLVSNITPQGFITSRSFINPRSNYDPSKFNNIYPKDWGQRVPKAYSNLGYQEDPDDEDEDDEDEKEDGEDKEDKKEGENKEEAPEDNPENPEP